jgi:hypothetical protein
MPRKTMFQETALLILINFTLKSAFKCKFQVDSVLTNKESTNIVLGKILENRLLHSKIGTLS